MLETFFVTWLGVLAAQASPGPNLIAVAGVALAEGRKRALFVVLGISSGMLIWSAATAMGLATLLEAFPLSLVLLRFLGGGYLLWLALKAARAAWVGNTVLINPSTATLRPFTAWRYGLFVVLTNPKAAMMWAAVATFLFGAGLSSFQVLMFAPVGALSGFCIYGLYAVLFSSSFISRGYAKAARWIEAAFAAAFGALGGKLILDGINEIRR